MKGRKTSLRISQQLKKQQMLSNNIKLITIFRTTKVGKFNIKWHEKFKLKWICKKIWKEAEIKTLCTCRMLIHNCKMSQKENKNKDSTHQNQKEASVATPCSKNKKPKDKFIRPFLRLDITLETISLKIWTSPRTNLKKKLQREDIWKISKQPRCSKTGKWIAKSIGVWMHMLIINWPQMT